jgi:hypothetical protein
MQILSLTAIVSRRSAEGFWPERLYFIKFRALLSLYRVRAYGIGKVPMVSYLLRPQAALPPFDILLYGLPVPLIMGIAVGSEAVEGSAAAALRSASAEISSSEAAVPGPASLGAVSTIAPEGCPEF